MFIAPSNKANQVRSFVAGRKLAGWGSFFAKFSQQACAAYLKRYKARRMFRHILICSFQSSLFVTLSLTILSLPYGSAAFIFGALAFPIAFVMGSILAYPLIKLWLKNAWSSKFSFLVFLCIGFILGCATPIVLFSKNLASIDIQSFLFLSIYGGLGVVGSLWSWHYVRRNIAL